MKRIAITLALLLLLALVVGPFLVPVPPLEGSVSARSLAGPHSEFVTIDGVAVHVERGDAVTAKTPTFLLLHGFGASVFTWHAVHGRFAELGHTLAYDRTAFGLTDRPLPPDGGWPDDGNPYSTAASIRQAMGVLDHYRSSRAVLVGNSAGGRIAVDIAPAEPRRVAALILVSTAVGMAGGPPRWISPLLGTPQLDHLGPLLARRIASGGGASLLKAAWHDPRKLTPEIVAGYRRPLRAHDWDKALWMFTRAPRTPDPLPRLAELAVIPTLVITGDDDRVAPVATSRAVAAALPGSKFVLLPA